MRSKDDAHEYRYFPDPDLLPLEIEKAWIEEIRKSLPELPDQKRARFETDYGLSRYDAGVLTSEADKAAFFEVVAKGRDAKLAAKYGADAIILSNHGGRQLDRAPVPLHLLADVKKELKNDMEIHIDTGIMHGADVLAAIALGADFAYIGRAYLYGLMAGGQEGVERALEIMQKEMVRNMKLLGVNSLKELEPKHVRILQTNAGLGRLSDGK
jgi:isopentenyl diphosphate isomerase/L-lactate dehydrogenase-like FMN-dependent dehydrogenase